MPRLRLYDCRHSRLPRVLGFCDDDLPNIALYVNSAQRRLLMCKESGEEGWWGGWAEVAFNAISRTNPYVTCPREIARIEKLDVCKHPVWIKNQFYEYLDFGNGRMPKRHQNWGCNVQAYTRNNVITWADTTLTDFVIRVYPVDSKDAAAGKRILFQGIDTAGSIIYSLDGTMETQGVFLIMDTPFADTTQHFSAITGIQKDITMGQVQIFQVNPATGDERLLLIMEPGETVAGYRRYYLNNLPLSCCTPTTTTAEAVRVTAIVKLELIPVMVDTDYLLIQNLEAIIEEAISVRMSEMDNTESQQLAVMHHLNAIRNLNGELVHYLGKNTAAVNFAPFGTAKLEHQNIGYQI